MKSASSEWAARAFAALLGIALLGTETSAFAAEALCPQINKIVAAATDTPSFNSVAAQASGGKDEATAIPNGTMGCMISRFTGPGLDDSYMLCLGSANLPAVFSIAKLGPSFTCDDVIAL